MKPIASSESAASVCELPMPQRAEVSPVPAEARSPRKSVLLDRAYNEYCRLRAAGEEPDHAEFCARYPAIALSLARTLSIASHIKRDPEFYTEPPIDWPLAGALFLGFQLDRELGRGAFSHVFLATERALGNRRVVVKLSRLCAEEALTLGRLEHPNICPIYSVVLGGHSGLAAICMPYLGGATLDTLLGHIKRNGVPRRAQVILDAAQSRPAPPQQPDCLPHPRPAGSWEPAAGLRRWSYVAGVRHLARQLLDALAFIHTRGVVHRDLKPSNVLLAEAAVPMLLDFNLSGDVCRADGRFGGTPVYMSPEQLELMGTAGADDAFVDARSDLFSLGVILYELLAGVHPFAPHGQVSLPQMRRELLWNHNAGARPVRELNPAIEPAMAELIGRCLAYLPEDRPESAAAALALLPAPPLPAAPRMAAPGRAAALAVAASALIGGYLWIAPLHQGKASVLDSAPIQPALVAVAMSDLQLGHNAHARKDYQLAVTHLGRYLASNAKDADAWFTRGLAFLKLAEQGRQSFAMAVSDFREADQLRPDVQTKACLGYALQRNEEVENASVQYAAAGKMGCKHAAVFNNLGYIHLKLFHWSDAERCFDRALELQPELQAAHHNRGRMSLLRAKPGPKLVTAAIGGKSRAPSEEQLLQQALHDLGRAIDLGPTSSELYLDAARACTRLAVYDPELGDRAIGYLDLAMQHGLNPKQLERKHFTSVHAGHWWFDDLRRRPQLLATVSEAHLVVAIPRR